MTDYTLAFVDTATNYADYTTKPYSLGEAYPTTRAGLTFGVVDSNGDANTLNTADFSSPATPLLSGRISTTSTARLIRIDLPEGPGTYRVRCALGTNTSATDCGLRIFDNAAGAVNSDTPLHEVTGTAGAAGKFTDIEGTLHDKADWSANQGYEELTLPATVYITRAAAEALHLANIQFEHVATPLQPLKLREWAVGGEDVLDGVRVAPTGTNASAHYGNMKSAEVTTIYAQQPEGEIIGYIEAVNGATNYVISGGGLASYVELQSVVDYNGVTRTAIVCKDTRIPDTATATLDVRQETTSETKTTSFSWTLVPAPGRPTDNSILGRLSTQTWLKRKTIHDVAATAWQGVPEDPTYASDELVSTLSDLADELNNLSTTGDASTYHRIRLQSGDYTGNEVVSAKQLPGGVVIEPDDGATVTFNGQLRFNNFNGLHIRNLTISANISGGSYAPQFRFDDPGTSDGYSHRVAITNVKVGKLHTSGTQHSDMGTTPQNANIYTSIFFFYHGESLYIEDADHYGQSVGYSINGVRAVYIKNLRERASLGDFIKISKAYEASSTHGLLTDDNVYVWIEGRTTHEQLDYTGFSTAAHQDTHQISAFNQNISFWYPNTGQDGAQADNGSNPNDPIKNWLMDQLVYAPNNRIYKVVGVPTTSSNGQPGGITGSTVPSAFLDDQDTSTNITDGEVTWDFEIANSHTADTLYVYNENCLVHSAAYVSDPPSIQYFINSNDGHNMKTETVLVNCLCATPSSRGVDNISLKAGDIEDASGQSVDKPYWIGEVQNETYVEFCSFMAPAKVSDSRTINAGELFPKNGTRVHSRYNLVGKLGEVKDAALLSSIGDAVIDFESSAVSGTKPNEELHGGTSITQYGSNNNWGYTSLVDTGLSREEITSDLSETLHYNDGSKGARLREEFTVTCGTDSFTLVINP